ncbi:hypothetical protein RJ639_022063 [Escallonia herrerae]|uniref:Dirigent protein n=1 Tax=Escallonia herrerae TaxID=1293975 RepID=A0AA88V987_9ASTE|nr:hypothetical protein RJ639_022063 [Escallonia herrerae]
MALSFCCYASPNPQLHGKLSHGNTKNDQKVKEVLKTSGVPSIATSPHESLQNGNWVKLICGASFEDIVDVRNLSLVYTLAGVDCIDCAADASVVSAVNEGIEAAREILHFRRPWVMISINDDEDLHFRKAGAITYVRDAAATAELLRRDDVDAVEIHTNGRQTVLFDKLWNGLGDSVTNLRLVAVSFNWQVIVGRVLSSVQSEHGHAHIEDHPEHLLNAVVQALALVGGVKCYRSKAMSNLLNFASNSFIPLLALPLLYWAYAFHKRQPKQTNLVFYVHDYLSGQDASAITVAGKEGPSTSILQFGTLLAVDDPVTVGPDPSSKQIGRAQGMYINSQLDGKGLHLVFSVIFTDGEYKGSTLEIQGADIFAMKEREFSVVSGTGYFRFVKGYGIMTTEFMDIPNLRAILKLNYWNFKGIGLTEILMLVPVHLKAIINQCISK